MKSVWANLKRSLKLFKGVTVLIQDFNMIIHLDRRAASLLGNIQVLQEVDFQSTSQSIHSYLNRSLHMSLGKYPSDNHFRHRSMRGLGKRVEASVPHMERIEKSKLENISGGLYISVLFFNTPKDFLGILYL